MNKEELPEFTFDIQCEDQMAFVGKFLAVDIEHAVIEARRLCKRFTLPGWVLRCRETGDTLPAVQFIDHSLEGKSKKVYK